MKVCFLGAIRKNTGVMEQDVQAPTIGALLASLSETYGTAWRDHVFDGKELVPGVVVLVNGVNINRSQGISTPLAAEDQVHILPLFEGG